MNLSALHTAVRTMVRDGVSEVDALGIASGAEREAVLTLRRRLAKVEGDLVKLVPPAGSLIWLDPPVRELAR